MNRAPSPWRLQAHAELASTQDCAIAAARQGEAGMLAVIADRQTSGRGSRGRAWHAPGGNLNLSALLRPVGARPDPGYWAMLAGVALYEALSPYATDLMLKWPNDIMRNGAKLGGILIDSAVFADGTLDWVVIGFGANLAAAPLVEGRPTACLPPTSPPAPDIAARVLRCMDMFAGTDVRTAWLARGHAPGTQIDVVIPDRRITGRFAGLTSAGALLLQNHPDPFISAEIFVQQAATEVVRPAAIRAMRPAATGGQGRKAIPPQPCPP